MLSLIYTTKSQTMKTSMLLLVLILFNTTALIAEPIAQLMKELNSWFLIISEAILVLIYYINLIIKDVRNKTAIDFNNLKLFI